VDDPGNELIHLYEIFEALSKHFGAQEKARHCLHFTKAEWQCLKRLGQLANDEPLEQGRHRGRHPMLRPASPQELAEARTIAKKLVEAFMSTL